MDLFEFISPSPLLAPFVKHYWGLKADSLYVSERIAPIGCVQLVFHRGDGMFSLTEQNKQPLTYLGYLSKGFIDVQSTGKTDMLVVLFQPHGARAFFNLPLNEVNNRNVSVNDMDDRPLQQLAEQVRSISDNTKAVELIEKFFISRLNRFDLYNHKRLVETIRCINRIHQSEMKCLADTACLGYKQFSRIFSEYIGTTPKEFTRIIRFQRALYLLQNNPHKDQVELALDCGFYDQSHLIKEFKTFSGYTPNEYMAVCKPYSDYFTIIQ